MKKFKIYYILDDLSIFINGRVTGTGIFYIHLSANQVEGSRKKRATGSGSSSGAAVYAPRVWNETIKAWVPSDEVEVRVTVASYISCEGYMTEAVNIRKE